MIVYICRPCSFYGTSHVTAALQEARSSTSVSLRFRTGRGDALLLVAAGRTDYLLMLLEGGLLKVRINLGAGEGEVTSPSDRRLDDLLWHDVQVQRNNADLALTIDGVHVTRIELPGRFFELNIHYGVFVGGMGDFSEIFLGLLDNFRGCLHQVRFNEVEILAQARDRNAAHHVTWGCDKQFDADADVSMSFVDERSYAMMPSLLPRVGGTIRLDLKTSCRRRSRGVQ
ncbi:Chondroitin sulfate proteoglycan 4 [Amphibalanus amphitrite]|uniref:Chondroitin sulfate proteoglycan 4 n=1 Tax=Amphibalanus amphitrite TaxID=1232801 RepID=A0A6A4W1L1_AMPAM|nr:Chondroitin sulfate proteoglycan 4 [Amphibalanus amphitrite]